MRSQDIIPRHGARRRLAEADPQPTRVPWHQPAAGGAGGTVVDDERDGDPVVRDVSGMVKLRGRADVARRVGVRQRRRQRPRRRLQVRAVGMRTTCAVCGSGTVRSRS